MVRPAGSSATDATPRTRVRSLARQAVRWSGVVTAGLRPGPDFLMIGAKRAGTTSLYYALLDHQQVLPMYPSASVLPMRENSKGVHYFDTGYHHGERWYRSHFPTSAYRSAQARRTGRRRIVGEASPYYLFHPRAADRAVASVPDARILVMLRDPVERAYSHFREQRRRGMEPLATFEDAIAAEPDRLAGAHERLLADSSATSAAHEHQSYVRQGRYADSLQPWLRRFPMPATLVVFSSDFFANPHGVYDEVCRFLGVEPHVLTDVGPKNASGGSAIDPATARRLRQEYEPYDEALAQLLGRHLPWRTLDR